MRLLKQNVAIFLQPSPPKIEISAAFQLLMVQIVVRTEGLENSTTAAPVLFVWRGNCYFVFSRAGDILKIENEVYCY